ncbi:hypothetical protein ACIPSJ_19320 [Streptomyces sp. NPDC090088]|uniref:hypothetical protein n=1 Tax=Streptomyces sp. NPDC090088 TaxID=3365944 RepID=UPI00380103EA
MTSPPPGPLRLDADRMRTAADFHEAYGHLVEPDEGEDGDFKALVEAASAYRLAGQWRLLTERAPGVELLLHAAWLFSRAGLAYGAYLRAALAPDRYGDQLDSWTERLLRTAGQRHGASEHVQQQTYLLLACARLTTPGSAQAAELRSFATGSPHRDGVVPVGSMAMPVRTFWGLALDMLSPEDGPAARRYARTLAELSRAYARTVDLAMANTLTWFNAAAPIDVADLDVIGTVAMGVQHFGLNRIQGLLTTGTELSAVALVPLDLGMSVASPERPPRPPTPYVRLDDLPRLDDLGRQDDLGRLDDPDEPEDLGGPDRPNGPDDWGGPGGGLGGL